MYKVTLLSIPNYWLTYYIHGFYQHKSCKLIIRPNPKFESLNYSNRCAIEICYEGKQCLILLDTDDPTDNHLKFGQEFDHVFLSQKLKSVDYQPAQKYHSLPPHFPIRSFEIQKLLNFRFFFFGNAWKNLKEFVIITTKLKPLSLISTKVNLPPIKKKYYFYHRSLWKKELNTNLLGATVLDAFKEKGFKVEGGLFRSDGFRTGIASIDKWVEKTRFSTKDYVQKTQASEYCFNSPAVRGACSWRFGEYLAMDKTILSTKFEVEIPEQIKFIELSNDADQVIDQIADLPDDFDHAQFSNRVFWKEHLLPVKQIDYILRTSIVR